MVQSITFASVNFKVKIQVGPFNPSIPINKFNDRFSLPFQVWSMETRARFDGPTVPHHSVGIHRLKCHPGFTLQPGLFLRRILLSDATGQQ